MFLSAVLLQTFVHYFHWHGVYTGICDLEFAKELIHFVSKEYHLHMLLVCMLPLSDFLRPSGCFKLARRYGL